MNGSVIFLVLFAVCTVLVYMAIRRGWAQSKVVAILGIIVLIILLKVLFGLI